MATYRHNSQKLIRRRIIVTLILVGLALLGGVAFWFFTHLQGERQLSAVDPPEESSERETSVFSDNSEPLFDSAEQPVVELEEIHDNQRRANIDAIHDGLQAYVAEQGAYPSLNQLNSDGFRSSAFPNLDDTDFLDPAEPSSRVVITRTPQPGVYSYEPVNDEGYTCEPYRRTCVGYTLAALLSDGTEYTRSSDNP